MEQTIQQAAVALADEAIDLSRSLDDGARAVGTSGILIAEGDSWFAYPGTNLIKELKRLGFRIESNAENGSLLEDMAYSKDRLADLHGRMREAQQEWAEIPRAILLSGGGNDIVNEPLLAMLNHAAAGEPALDPQMVEAMIDVRLANAIRSWIASVQRLVADVWGEGVRVPVVMHGYDYPVPDGRGYKKIGVTWRGPWMQPDFHARGFDDLGQSRDLIAILITRYNDMVARLASTEQGLNLRYANLLNTLSSDLSNYKDSWDNELHPEKEPFRLLADRLVRVIP